MALVDIGDVYSPSQTRLADLQVLRDLRDRLLPQPRQFDSSTPELRRSRCWYLRTPLRDDKRLRIGVRKAWSGQIGIYDNASRQPETLLGAIIDATTFTATFGSTAAQDPHIIVATRAGSAQTVADQLPVALRVDDPNALTATALSSSATLRGSIDRAVQQLLVVLAVVAIIIGALSIANGTLVSAVERIPEIGLRRALGATRGDMATQFMFEGAVTGTIGGILGYGPRHHRHRRPVQPQQLDTHHRHRPHQPRAPGRHHHRPRRSRHPRMASHGPAGSAGIAPLVRTYTSLSFKDRRVAVAVAVAVAVGVAGAVAAGR